MRNIAHLCSRKNSHTWGVEAWKKVCLNARVDGLAYLDPRWLYALLPTVVGKYIRAFLIA
jgi:chitin synthase